MKNGAGVFSRKRRQLSKRAPGLAVAALLALATGCSGGGQGQAQAGGGPPGLPVKVQIVQASPINETTEYVATLKSRDSAVVMPEVEGRITQIYVHSGDRVRSGMPLMQIDPTKQEATVSSQEQMRAAQQASVAWAQQQYERSSGLYKAGVVSKQDLDQAQTALETARAQLESLDAQVRQQRVQLHYYKVIAPREGIVGDIPVHVGDRVVTSTLLTTVDQPGALEAYIYVPVERTPQLKLNMAVEIVDAAGKLLAHSRVSFISPEVDTSTQSVLVKARISNNRERLRTSQFIRARVVWSERQAPRVPILSVANIGGQYFAFVAQAENGKIVARQKLLHVGEMQGNDYVVLDGIKPGEKVIISGTQFLTDGAPVMPQA
ncbi:MAG: efflux RND transporter periplasmic adaptor subunit [Acidobacteria bacterium]|nr:efflux RND transporter periplasmic adaptor subunit [Acidobacteriota bacterium]MBV9625275.1 efflux RND transporter periplasmic adaptor subunit [Acidobacteriota bacterium]